TKGLNGYDLRYYWTFEGGLRETKKMNLSSLKAVVLGISRKALNQAQQGTLYIKAIRLLGPPEQSKK
ncbi:MAG: hypothetical protein KAY65_16635, partial [Planctomycetes bacterium]|nr:hypothetical protein [Planctomycetota bacterium]